MNIEENSFFLDCISKETKFHFLDEEFVLENGTKIENIQIAYRTWGKISEEKNNVVLVCHALTGSADVDEWWSQMFNEGEILDPKKYFVICSNILGSCYGTTGPMSMNMKTNQSYGPDFPEITIRDMVHLQKKLLDALKIKKILNVIGGSLGGMQALEWGIIYEDMVSSITPIATSAKHSAWCIGLSEAQRAAIKADALWQKGKYHSYNQPVKGLAAARMMAMCSYRGYQSFEKKFNRNKHRNSLFAVESYLLYQGQKLTSRFDANTYVTLTKAMDKHDLGFNREGCWQEVLENLHIPVCVISISTDVLYHPAEQKNIAKCIRNSFFCEVDSIDGHDGFLTSAQKITNAVKKFYTKFSL